jgi:DNA-binding GntR family transcriptional regulator
MEQFDTTAVRPPPHAAGPLARSASHAMRRGATADDGAGKVDRDALGAPIDAVYQRLRDAILNVQLLPNAVLPENELANMLHVSRTPVREAIQKLCGEGLVQVVPQVGTFVARMDLARIREAMFMREAVECTAMSRLAKKLPAAALDRLREIVAAHLRAVKDRDLENTLASDEAFHRYLLEVAGVPGAWRYVLEARDSHRRVRVLSHSQFNSAHRSVVQHSQMVDELAAGRPAKSMRLLREHIRMNALFAEEISRAYPTYFTQPSTMDDVEPGR